MGDGATISPEIVALADRMIAAIEVGDPRSIAACFSVDARIWHNYDGLEVPLSDVLPLLAALVSQVSDLRYDDIRRRARAAGASLTCRSGTTPARPCEAAATVAG